MQKLFGIVISILLIFSFHVASEAVNGGSKGTSILNVKTAANWAKPGQESVTLIARDMSGKPATGIYKIYLDGKYVGMLGKPWSHTIKINLQRNRLHAIKVVYDEAKTKYYYKKATGMNMGSNVVPNWSVLKMNKIATYW